MRAGRFWIMYLNRAQGPGVYLLSERKRGWVPAVTSFSLTEKGGADKAPIVYRARLAALYTSSISPTARFLVRNPRLTQPYILRATSTKYTIWRLSLERATPRWVYVPVVYTVAKILVPGLRAWYSSL